MKRDFRCLWSKDDPKFFIWPCNPTSMDEGKLLQNTNHFLQPGSKWPQTLRCSAYLNDCHPGVAHFVDNSKLWFGRHCHKNRLNCLSDGKFDWASGISRHQLRIEIKKTFIRILLFHLINVLNTILILVITLSTHCCAGGCWS